MGKELVEREMEVKESEKREMEKMRKYRKILFL